VISVPSPWISGPIQKFKNINFYREKREDECGG
jgi:hypothetical protein